jgi:hypothetical protein
MTKGSSRDQNPAKEGFEAKLPLDVQEPSPARVCPDYGKIDLDYDGCLNLVCPYWGHASSGASD